MTRRVLIALLGLGMAVLSFDALRAYALDGKPLTQGVIPAEAILPRPWLAMGWAVMIDLAAAAGILGVKDDRGDWRAWLMLLAALAATLGFQVLQFPPMVARAVPPVGLALAILVLDLGPGRPRPQRTTDPVPARFHRWLGSWSWPTPLGHPVPDPAQPDPDPAPEPDQPERTRTRSRVHDVARQPRPTALGRPVDQAAQLAAQGYSATRITRDLGLSDRARRTWVGDLVREHRPTPANRNGDGP